MSDCSKKLQIFIASGELKAHEFLLGNADAIDVNLVIKKLKADR